jgi:hypothetical protein
MPTPYALCLPTASSSSIKTMQGAFSFAVLNISLTRKATTQTNISINSAAEIEINETPASPANAFANNVISVPGGPINNAPLGILASKFVYFSGASRNLPISLVLLLFHLLQQHQQKLFLF